MSKAIGATDCRATGSAACSVVYAAERGREGVVTVVVVVVGVFCMPLLLDH